MAVTFASYGVDQVDVFHRAASYVDRILKGENFRCKRQPSSSRRLISKPPRRSTFTVPQALIANADEVIE
jgi:putative tryptophan/tyrosine transport system substrate-binding protein